MKPQGIQLKRTKGFNLQVTSLALNGLPCVKVARPTRYGNPFKVGERSPGNHTIVMDAEHACQWFESILEAKEEFGILEEFLAPLRGNNLACFCAMGTPCHRDILLKWANK